MQSSILMLPLVVLMQAPPLPVEADAIARARAFADSGQWTEAIELLQQEEQRCAPLPEAVSCRARVLFTRGFVHAAHAEADRELRTQELENAAKAYREVEMMQPGNPQILSNFALVLADLGDWAGAVDRLSRAANADVAQRGSYYLEAAEICRDAGRNDDAATWYEKAAEQGEGALAWPRLVGLLEELIEAEDNPPQKDRLVMRLIMLGAGLASRGEIELALNAYEAGITKGYRTVPEVAEEALVRWLDLKATTGGLGTAGLRRVPGAGAWDAPAVTELVRLAENPATSPEWWSQRNERRHAWAAALASIADELAVHDAERAASIYERAMAIAPMPPFYNTNSVLAQRPIVFLDAAVRLARLLNAQPRLDRDGRRFHMLEEMLFSGKALGYQLHNPAATQRTHAALGLVYAERGVWTGGAYTNATYQLQAALTEAAEREKQEGILLPLPHLNEMLAEAYARQGAPGKAVEQLAAAAKSYLDIDAVDRAAATIARAKGLDATPVPDALKARLDSLESIASFRGRISSLTAESIQTEKLPELPTVLDENFRAGQQFKMLADLAERGETVGTPDATRDLYLRALDSVKDQKNLSGTGDVLRMQRIEDSVQQRVVIDSNDISESGTNFDGISRFDKGKVWQLPESSSLSSARQLAWSADLLLAAKAAAVGKPAEADITFKVIDSAIVVEAPPESREVANSTAARLEKAGLKNVTTATKIEKSLAVVSPP